MGRGTGDFGLYSLDITSYDPSQGINGELGPFSNNYTHASYFALNDPSGFDPMTGILHVDVPLEGDANGNGYADFFEVSEGVSGTTTGVYSIPGVVSSGSVTARWTRGAGSEQGTCVITMQNLGDFTHAFMILEYRGTLRYTAGPGTVTGTIELVQAGMPDYVLGGTCEFQKSGAEPHNRLQLQAGSWTNSFYETLSFPADWFQREEQPWRTNYYGYVEFDNDGDVGSFYPYALHLLSIDDANDADGDGVPDFSDEPGAAVNRPMLTVRGTPNGVLLTVTGSAGIVCAIEESGSLSGGVWQTVRTVTLTGTSVSVELPLAAGATGFWRARVQ